jgi:hypothetical protein
MRCDKDAGKPLFDPCVAISTIGCIKLVGVSYKVEGRDFVDVIEELEVEITRYALFRILEVYYEFRRISHTKTVETPICLILETRLQPVLQEGKWKK